jgi:hypothetical protein
VTHNEEDEGVVDGEYDDDVDDFIVDDENRPLPKPSHRRSENAP